MHIAQQDPGLGKVRIQYNRLLQQFSGARENPVSEQTRIQGAALQEKVIGRFAVRHATH